MPRPPNSPRVLSCISRVLVRREQDRVRVERAQHAVGGGVLDLAQLDVFVLLQVLLQEAEDLLVAPGQRPRRVDVVDAELAPLIVDLHLERGVAVLVMDDDRRHRSLNRVEAREQHLAVVDALGLDVVLVDLGDTALRTRTWDRSYGTRVFAACARGDVSISKLSPFCCGHTKVMQNAAATANSTRNGLSQRFMKLGSLGSSGRECTSVAGGPGSLHALFWARRAALPARLAEGGVAPAAAGRQHSGRRLALRGGSRPGAANVHSTRTERCDSRPRRRVVPAHRAGRFPRVGRGRQPARRIDGAHAQRLGSGDQRHTSADA